MSINLLKNADLKDLEVLDSSGLTLSVYLPLDQANIEINRIRLKNAVSEVQALLEERLEDTGIAGQVAEQIAELSSHEVFAKAQYPGLALLVDLEKPEALSAFPLWEQPENRVSVGQEPFLTPLIRDQGYERVTLLCLADNGLRLFRGRCGELSEETPSEAFPENLTEVIRWELSAGLDGNEHYRNKTSSPGVHSPHGEGPTGRVTEEFERRYFRKIGQALSDLLSSEEKLFLAGVHEKLALFRDENSSLPILDEELHGNYEEIEASKILKEANRTLAEGARKRLSAELEKALDLPPEKRSSKSEEISEAAEAGRIETLFLKHGSPLENQDQIALKVLNKSGRIHVVDDPDWSDDALAKFRW